MVNVSPSQADSSPSSSRSVPEDVDCPSGEVVTKAINLPGYLGLADSLKARAAALGESDVPAEWTPEHVGVRLIEAFEVLARSAMRPGPRQFANGWPAMVHEFADMVDAQARTLAEKEKQQARAARPTTDELSRMEEALRWPMDHLAGRPLAADSLMLWAYAKAGNRDMYGMLHHRKKRATALAAEMMRRANADPRKSDCRSLADQWRVALRRQVAAEVADEGNRALAASGDPAKADGIRLKARAEFARRCKEINCPPVRYQPHQAVPGRALARTTLDRYRKQAMAIVAERLRAAGVVVR